MVPGQVIDRATIDFMRKLDVKEIHGFNASLGLKLLNPSFLHATTKPGPAAKDEAPNTKRKPARAAARA
jgi:arginine decarboxylase